jgi:ribosomal 50S subunit-associated protein YjgA (DUF615 family)
MPIDPTTFNTVTNIGQILSGLAKKLAENEDAQKTALQATSNWLGIGFKDEGINTGVKMSLKKAQIWSIHLLLQSLNRLQKNQWRQHLTHIPIEESKKTVVKEGKKETVTIEKVDNRLRFLEFIAEMVEGKGVDATKQYLITENIISENDDMAAAVDTTIDAAKNPGRTFDAVIGKMDAEPPQWWVWLGIVIAAIALFIAITATI